jgi:hypothetical protein
MKKSITLMLLLLITAILQSCYGASVNKQSNIQLSGLHAGLFIPSLCPRTTQDDISQDTGSIMFWTDHRASLYVYDKQVTIGDFFTNKLNLDDSIPSPCFFGQSNIYTDGCYVQNITLQNCKYKNNAFSADYVVEFLGSDGRLNYRKGIFGFHN